ncbi:MAG: hypothetical protein QM719_10360 [Thermomonas sp.]
MSRAFLAGTALAFGLAGTAQADTVTRLAQVPAGMGCHLSIPTVETAVRPRATGFRNEGTASVFAICGIQDPVQGAVSEATITFYSLDGKPHTFSCTGVNGWPDEGHYLYSTKSVTATSPTSRTSLVFEPTDFGGTGTMPQDGFMTVTCALPPNVSVGTMSMHYSKDIGS